MRLYGVDTRVVSSERSMVGVRGARARQRGKGSRGGKWRCYTRGYGSGSRDGVGLRCSTGGARGCPPCVGERGANISMASWMVTPNVAADCAVMVVWTATCSCRS
jgi:hypothetical protein